MSSHIRSSRRGKTNLSGEAESRFVFPGAKRSELIHEDIWCQGHVLYLDMMVLVNMHSGMGSPSSKVLVVTESGLEAELFNVTHVSHVWLFSHKK
jgi:hypothetical protein